MFFLELVAINHMLGKTATLTTNYLHLLLRLHSLQLQKRSKDLTHKIAVDEGVLRRSTRVRAPPRENPAAAFLRYVNKWKED